MNVSIVTHKDRAYAYVDGYEHCSTNWRRALLGAVLKAKFKIKIKVKVSDR